MSGIFCVIDGMTDEGFRREDYPILDRLAGEGATGLFDTIPKGAAPGTLPCMLTLLGLAAEEIPLRGRGWLEAEGLGLPLAQDDLIVRVTWSETTADGRVVGVTSAPQQVSLPPHTRYYPLGGYKGLLIFSGWGSSCPDIVTHPPHHHWGEALAALLPSGCAPLEEFYKQNATAAVVPMLWGQSEVGALPTPPQLEGGAVVTGTPLVAGMARLLGLRQVKVATATGDTDTDLGAKTAAAGKAAEQAPWVLLHLGGADEAAHRRDPAMKRAFLQRVDSQVLGPLARQGHRLLICADHGTSPHTGRHLAGAQPFVLWGSPQRGDQGLLPGGQAIKRLKEDTLWQK